MPTARNAGLADYRSKRDFTRTPEPAPRARGADDRDGWFVIQQHAASTMHWDFRLAIDGVLVSWAVPKGPSTDPREKRLAVRTEDHPLAYADFEGVIPEGAYGAGTVIVWDRGRYRNLLANTDEPKTMAESLAAGHIEVGLAGRKLRGGWALIHARLGRSDANWLLVKMGDEFADARRNPVSTQSRSVKTGRTLAQVRRAG